MSMALPAAVLYTRTQYLAGLRPTKWARRHMNIPISDHLREELAFWLGLKTVLINGAHWISPAHFFLNLSDFVAFSDASSRRSGRVIVCSTIPFATAEDFGLEQAPWHINVKDTAAFWSLLNNFLPAIEKK